MLYLNDFEVLAVEYTKKHNKPVARFIVYHDGDLLKFEITLISVKRIGDKK